ncbi:aldo/keto reductase [Rahnella sp. Lac-M11]|jgi:diketogulonate reductase-like aldo/keto reductase|uniref:Aldo/keto reductase n=1 Tax=Rahnella contaminans TaxID=2703882 RepID=A0A6M2B707_9GAMM|nr:MULTISPECIES: aldo/keto reductase [Yersiniaceae]MCS3424533.1 diketogulonate reductase-like aldo/keto reductase [Rahnella sp. BIGb0603]NGX88795.1 aldo/keto reductase [Rahnella contaminans]CFQ45893.1 2%2C5-diketo-D-gluconate reductase A [Yersinia aleksiciae]
MNGKNPYITLNNGVKMPALGLGVFQSKPEETTEAVKTALNAGYRLIDTAAAYFNEREVGEGIRQSDVNRADIFIETKLWITNYGYEPALRAFDVSLNKLGIEQLDLWLLHQPLASEFDKTIQAYKAAEKLLTEGRVRAIGVSNLTPSELDRLIAETDVIPAVNQIQVHPYYSQAEWRTANDRYGILTQCWSPLGGSYTYNNAEKNPFEDKVITDIAKKYSKTPAQVILRWHLDHGFSAIPKSVKPHRITENFDVFDFRLSSDEIAAIDALETGVRGGPDPDSLDLATYGFKIPD